jgi:hypothetical protein
MVNEGLLQAVSRGLAASFRNAGSMLLLQGISPLEPRHQPGMPSSPHCIPQILIHLRESSERPAKPQQRAKPSRFTIVGVYRAVAIAFDHWLRLNAAGLGEISTCVSWEPWRYARR